MTPPADEIEKESQMTDHKKSREKPKSVYKEMESQGWRIYQGSYISPDQMIEELNKLPTRPSLEPLGEKAVLKVIRDHRSKEEGEKFFVPIENFTDLAKAIVAKFGKPRVFDEVMYRGYKNPVEECIEGITEEDIAEVVGKLPLGFLKLLPPLPTPQGFAASDIIVKDRDMIATAIRSFLLQRIGKIDAR